MWPWFAISNERVERAKSIATNVTIATIAKFARSFPILTAIGTATVCIVLLWHFTPLAHYLHPRVLFHSMRDVVHGSRYEFVLLTSMIAVGNLIFIPINLLLIAVAMMYPGWHGFFCGLAGAVCAAWLQYSVGLLLGKSRLRRELGPGFEILSSEIANNGLSAMIVLGLVPIAPNLAINLVAGVCRIPIWKLTIGTIVGFLPGLAVMNLLSRQMRKLIEDPSLTAALSFFGIVLFGAFGLYIARRYRMRRYAHVA